MKNENQIKWEKNRRLFILWWVLFMEVVILTPTMFFHEPMTMDLSAFSGRIIPSSKVHIQKELFYSYVSSLEEALKWGNTAVLSYDVNKIEIWKPDNATSGMWQYCGIFTSEQKGAIFRTWKIRLENKSFVFESCYPTSGVIFVGICSVCIAIFFIFKMGPEFSGINNKEE